jgi:hypothetical protein
MAGPLTRHEQGRWRKQRPVQLVFLAQAIEEGRSLLRLGLVLGRKRRGRHQPDPGRDVERTGAADHKIAPDAGGLCSADQDFRIARQEMDRRDGHIVPGPEPGQRLQVIGVSLDRLDAGQLRDPVGVAGDGGNQVVTAGEFGRDARTGCSGRAGDGDLHRWLLSTAWYPTETR